MLVNLTYNQDEINRLDEIFKKENLGSAKDLYPFLEDEKTYHPNKGCYIGNGFNINTSLFVKTKGKSESRILVNLKDDASILMMKNLGMIGAAMFCVSTYTELTTPKTIPLVFPIKL